MSTKGKAVFVFLFVIFVSFVVNSFWFRVSIFLRGSLLGDS